MSEGLPLAINIGKFSAYRLAPDEVVLFEWLIFKQCYFGVGYFFYYSRKKIEEATRIKRRRLEAIIKTFEDMGFLKTELGVEKVTNNQVIYYSIDFKELTKDCVLGQIVDESTVFYNDLQRAFRENARRSK